MCGWITRLSAFALITGLARKGAGRANGGARVAKLNLLALHLKLDSKPLDYLCPVSDPVRLNKLTTLRTLARAAVSPSTMGRQSSTR
jgi:hypothetical protein